MRTQYWDFLVLTKYQLLYAEKYHERARKLNNALIAISLILSSTAVAGWLVWQHIPWIWSLLIGMGQILAIIKPLFPYSDRMSGLRFLIPELKMFFTEIEKLWNELSEGDDEQFVAPLKRGRERYAELESKYLSTHLLPDISGISDKSWEDCESYMQTYFPYLKGSGAYEADSCCNDVEPNM